MPPKIRYQYMIPYELWLWLEQKRENFKQKNLSDTITPILKQMKRLDDSLKDEKPTVEPIKKSIDDIAKETFEKFNLKVKEVDLDEKKKS